MAYTLEPDILKGSNLEDSFQKAVKEEIKKIIEQKKSEGPLKEYYLLEKFGLDLAIFLSFTDNRSLVKFFELKAFVGSRQGGVGIGNQKGEGSQIDILMLENEKIKLADEFVRWILIDVTKSKRTNRFSIFDNQQAKNSVMNGVHSGKQNNLRVNSLMKNSITWDELSKELAHFISL